MCGLVTRIHVRQLHHFEGTKVVRMGPGVSADSGRVSSVCLSADGRQHGYQCGSRFLAWPRHRAVTRLTHVSVDTEVRCVAVWYEEHWAVKGNWREDDV